MAHIEKRSSGKPQPTETRSLEKLSPFLLVEEAAAVLRYHPETVRELVRAKRLGAHKRRGVWLLPQGEVTRFLGELNTVNTTN